MNLQWYAPVYGQSGYEQISRGLLIALDKLGIRIFLYPDRVWNQNEIHLDPEDAERLRRMQTQKMADSEPKIFSEFPKENCFATYSVFETDTCPHIEEFKKAEQIWTFSSFNLDDWQQVCDNKVHKIPVGLDLQIYNEKGASAQITNLASFNFISVGDWTLRKNFEDLISVYVNEFQPDEDVALVLKVHFAGFVKKHFDDVKNKIYSLLDRAGKLERHPKILFFPYLVDNEDMAKLYRACQCFVLATHGEGICLPALEASACGLPVIITGYGGHTDYFVDGRNGFLIPYEMQKIESLEYFRLCPKAYGHRWARISLPDLQKRMRWIFENKEKAKEVGKEGAEMAKELTWQKTGLKILEIIT